ncbi:MAG: acyltransferase family protein [Abditibacteriota bacterium]|nr:acyltransferase family protein [Abditibacteriota bacterium]
MREGKHGERDRALDMLKGFGIFLMVYGHVDAVYQATMAWAYIYSFHMPLFFIASGMVYNPKNESFWVFCAKKAKSLLVPYLSVILGSFVIGSVIANATGQPFFSFDGEFLKRIYIFVFGRYDKALYDLGMIHIGPVWFLHALFFSFLAFWFIAKTKKPIIAVITVLLCAFALFTQLTEGPMLHYGVKNTPLKLWLYSLTTFYLCVGYLCKLWGIGECIKKYNPYTSVVLLVASSAAVLINHSFGYMQHIKSAWYIPVSICLVLGWYGVLALPKGNKLLEYLGRNSLYILCLHGFVWYPVYKIICLLGGGAAKHHVYGISAAVINLAICCALFESYKYIKSKTTKKPA